MDRFKAAYMQYHCWLLIGLSYCQLAEQTYSKNLLTPCVRRELDRQEIEISKKSLGNQLMSQMIIISSPIKVGGN